MRIDIPKGTRPTSDKLAVLLSELQHATAITAERRRGFWIDIHSRQWRRILGRGYAGVIRAAEEAGFVEVNHRYSQGRFSKSVRLTKRYRRPDVAQVRISQRFRKSGGNRIRLEQNDATGHLLASWFDSVTIPANITARGWDLYAVRSVQQRDWYATRCPYRRFHSTFTGLPRFIRSELRIEGESVVEIDVSNCQPIILGIMASTNTTTTTKNPYTICGAPKGLGSYLELCTKGELYDHLASIIGWSRDRVKRQFIVMMFADNPTTKRIPLFGVVAREWPALAEYIVEAKRGEYQNLAKECQRFESSVMIDGVAAELAMRIPLVTIHDSIIAQAEHAEVVAMTIQRCFAGLGVGVSIKQEGSGP